VRTTLGLAARSLRSRLVPSLLAALSVALGVALLVGVEQVRAGMRAGFAGTIRGTDLIVGARGGPVQLLLYTVFGVGTPTAGVSRAAYERWRAHPAVAWTIPYSLGDSHRGFRLVGTTADFYARYRFRGDGRVTFARGRMPTTDREAAVGAEAARALGYTLGSRVVATHGLAGFTDHAGHPFTVVGVLAPTATPIDRAIYVTLEGVEAMHDLEHEAGEHEAGEHEGGEHEGGHEEAHAGAPPAMPGAAAPNAQFGAADTDRADALSAFFVGTRNRTEALALKRAIDTDRAEPLTAAIPGVALAELWRTVGVAEAGLRAVSALVVLVGLVGMLLALYSALETRRREMAVLRAVGAGPRTIVTLLVLEAGLLGALGCALGVALAYALLAAARGVVEREFGLVLPLAAPGGGALAYLGAVVAGAALVGLVPAWKAYRTALADGLSARG